MRVFVGFYLLILSFGLAAQEISAHFNHNENYTYVDPYRNITKYGENLEQILIDNIKRAQSEILIAIHEIDLPLLTKEIVNAHKRGVDVKVVIENTYNIPFYILNQYEYGSLDGHYQSKYAQKFYFLDTNSDGDISQKEINERDSITMLKNANIPVVDDTFDGSMGSGLMHHKFVVIDRTSVVVSSANFTLSGIHGDYTNPYSTGNANALVVFHVPDLAQIFTTEFAIMYGDGFSGSGMSRFGINKPYRGEFAVTGSNWRVKGQFSATSESADWRYSTNALIGRQLSYAQESIHMALFVFSEQKLADILERRHQKGLEISILVDPSFISRSWSEVLDMWGLEMKDSQNCHYELGNRPWRPSLKWAGTPVLGSGDKLHHKFAVVDGRKVIFGSQNWSPSGAHKNDENVLVIENEYIAAQFLNEYQRMFSNSYFGPQPQLLEEIQRREQLCSGSF